jgi:hypothetical protein
MLQDYTSTQNAFRRFMPSPQQVLETSSHGSHPHISLQAAIGRPVDQTQYQFLLNKMQTQIDSFNTLRDLGKKFLETSPTNTNATTTK